LSVLRIALGMIIRVDFNVLHATLASVGFGLTRPYNNSTLMSFAKSIQRHHPTPPLDRIPLLLSPPYWQQNIR
jgi:hypothetical protein